MIKTLITRISKLEQYDEVNKSILWEDPTESRWLNVYGKLQPNDNAIFIASNKILIGTIELIKNNKNIQCKNIQELNCTNDQLLQLDEIYPELISRVKANFQPFIHTQEINIIKLISDVKESKFVSYYVFSDENKYYESAKNLNENDRVVLLNSNHTFEKIKLNTSEGLVDLPEKLDIHISVEGLSLTDALKKNENIKRKSAKSNNVSRIKKIIDALAKQGFYKFESFFAYHDTLYNKRVYGSGSLTSHSVFKIVLRNNESVYKVSMSEYGTGIDEDAFTYFNDKNLIVVHESTNAIARSSISQGDIFETQIKLGDYFYLCRGNRNLEVIGKITSNAEKCEYKNFGSEGWLQRSYEIVAEATSEDSYQDIKKWWSPNNNSTCSEIPKNEMQDANTKLFIPFFNTQFEYVDTYSTNNKDNNSMTIPLNQILFGPPGTGKTYNTINKALKIIGEKIDGKSRQDIKKIFDEKLNDGQIVFTTFHQSMNYEDFIEGIKPVEPEKDGDPVVYRIELGIFRNLCIEASFAIAKVSSNKATGEVLNFSNLYDKFAESIDEKLINGQKIEFKTKSSGSVIVESISAQGNFAIKHIDGTRTYTVSKARLSKLHAAISSLDDVSNIHDQFKAVIGGSNSSAYWSVLNAIRIAQPTLNVSKEERVYTIDEKREVVQSLTKIDFKNKTAKPFVLIIDEINRGNVSQIFGELITLIEEDKRLGNDETLEVTLPYSKEKFGVPSNLYIIGTMNTADRSVEALDAALRRRFSFEEMPPKSELIASEGKLKTTNGNLDGINLPILLETINKRIEKLIDKDHQIGHSYFISVEKIEDLMVTFKNKIIPLLQEYFFGDYGKIGLVLGSGFIESINSANSNPFANFETYDAPEPSEYIYKIKNITEMSEEVFVEAIHLLLK